MGWIDPNHGKTGALKRQLLRFSRMPFDGVAETAADFTKRRNQNKKPDDFWLEWQDLNLGPLASRTRVVIEKINKNNGIWHGSTTFSAVGSRGFGGQSVVGLLNRKTSTDPPPT
jgi:hypothetical protein